MTCDLHNGAYMCQNTTNYYINSNATTIKVPERNMHAKLHTHAIHLMCT